MVVTRGSRLGHGIAAKGRGVREVTKGTAQPGNSNASTSKTLSRRGVVARGMGTVASSLVLAALGGYAGWTRFGQSRNSVAFAASAAGKGTSSMGYDLEMTKGEIDEALKGLSDLSVRVTMQSATERSFAGQTVNGYRHDNKEDGVYVSAVGGLPLFDSKAKFDSGTGWPSFFMPIAPDHVREIKDTSIFFMPRVEIVDAKSGAHLGHVFDDGPAPTGKRYCMNAAALKFVPRADYDKMVAEAKAK